MCLIPDSGITVEPLYNGHPWGEQCFGLYIQRWSLLKGCFIHKLFIWDLGACRPLYSNWPLIIRRWLLTEVPLY